MKLVIAALAIVSSQAMALTLVTEDYPPFNMSNDGGKTVSGSSTDVMNEVLKRTGIKATIALYPWERAYKMAQEDKGTCVYSTTRTESREKLFKWVGPLVANSWVLYAKADSTISINTLDEAKKHTIGGYQGDATTAFLKEKGFKLDEAMRDELNVKKLEAGRVDLWVAGNMSGQWVAKKAGVKVKPVLTFKDVQLYAACNLAMPDDDIAKMNDAVKAIKSDGTFDQIMTAYQ